MTQIKQENVQCTTQQANFSRNCIYTIEVNLIESIRHGGH